MFHMQLADILQLGHFAARKHCKLPTLQSSTEHVEATQIANDNACHGAPNWAKAMLMQPVTL